MSAVPGEGAMLIGARFLLEKSEAVAHRALRQIVLHAARDVPYYRDLFARSGVLARRVDSTEALRDVPITYRKTLSEQPYARYLSERADEARCVASYTSGSTGTPATVFMSKLELNYRRLLLLRAVRARFPHCLPLRVTDVGQMTTQKTVRLSKRVGPIHLTRVPGNLPIVEQADRYIQSAPQLLEGYAGCLETLAMELATRSSYPRPRWVISRGELLAPPARDLLRRVFACPVANFYNSEEIGNMAWECRDQPGMLHVNTDACILELVDGEGQPAPPGHEGRVVVTNLYNQTMPFIRYDIGDHAVWDEPTRHRCSCGASTPTLASIDGRTDDFLVATDGHRIPPLIALTTVLNAAAAATPAGAQIPQVRQFQVVQGEAGSADVLVVTAGALPGGLAQRMAVEFRRLDPAFEVHVKQVERIEPQASGKVRRIVSAAGGARASVESTAD